MPMGNYVPTSGSSFSSASIPGSENRPVWVALTTAGASGMMRIHKGSGSGATTAILALAACTVTSTPLYGPIIHASGIYIEGPSGTGASAFGWLQP